MIEYNCQQCSKIKSIKAIAMGCKKEKCRSILIFRMSDMAYDWFWYSLCYRMVQSVVQWFDIQRLTTNEQHHHKPYTMQGRKGQWYILGTNVCPISCTYPCRCGIMCKTYSIGLYRNYLASHDLNLRLFIFQQQWLNMKSNASTIYWKQISRLVNGYI